MERVAESLFGVKKNRFPGERLSRPFRGGIVVLSSLIALPSPTILFPTALEVPFQEMDHAEVAVCLGFVGASFWAAA